MQLRSAATEDLAAMQAVAQAAGERFATIDDPRVARCAGDPPPSIGELDRYRAAGRARVAVRDGHVVGFVVLDLVDGHGHVEEIDVDPSEQGRGVGSALLEDAAGWASGAGLAPLTLTTFADVPWNRPWYERHGYRVLAADEWGPELAARVADEAAHGLDPTIRVCMQRMT